MEDRLKTKSSVKLKLRGQDENVEKTQGEKIIRNKSRIEKRISRMKMRGRKKEMIQLGLEIGQECKTEDNVWKESGEGGEDIQERGRNRM